MKAGIVCVADPLNWIVLLATVWPVALPGVNVPAIRIVPDGSVLLKLLKIRLPNVPGSTAWPALPWAKETVPVAALVRLPDPTELPSFTVSVLAPIPNAPFASVSTPLTVTLAESVTPAALLIVRSLTVVGRPFPVT